MLLLTIIFNAQIDMPKNLLQILTFFVLLNGIDVSAQVGSSKVSKLTLKAIEKILFTGDQYVERIETSNNIYIGNELMFRPPIGKIIFGEDYETILLKCTICRWNDGYDVQIEYIPNAWIKRIERDTGMEINIVSKTENGDGMDLHLFSTIVPTVIKNYYVIQYHLETYESSVYRWMLFKHTCSDLIYVTDILYFFVFN